MDTPRYCVVFSGQLRLADGSLGEVAVAAKRRLNQDQTAQILVFDDVTSESIELDLRGTEADVDKRYALPLAPRPHPHGPPGDQDKRGPGRPRLGVVAREVTLLPRHWEWLAAQPGGASVALRRLVEHARSVHQARDRHRRAQEAAYRFLTSMAGGLPGFEDATRALYAGKQDRFEDVTGPWPADIRAHARKLAARAFQA